MHVSYNFQRLSAEIDNYRRVNALAITEQAIRTCVSKFTSFKLYVTNHNSILHGVKIDAKLKATNGVSQQCCVRLKELNV